MVRNLERRSRKAIPHCFFIIYSHTKLVPNLNIRRTVSASWPDPVQHLDFSFLCFTRVQDRFSFFFLYLALNFAHQLLVGRIITTETERRPDEEPVKNAMFME